MFDALLLSSDARRARDLVTTVLASGLPCALTGGLAIAAQLRARGRAVLPRPLNDIDLVVERFDDIPQSLSALFLLNHVHADAAPGKTLLQLVDESRAVRIDIFRAYGDTMARAMRLDGDTGVIPVVSNDDLLARTTSMICTELGRGRPIDRKHVRSFRQLLDLGRDEADASAWSDHRERVSGTFDEAIREALRLLDARPDLVVVEEYSAAITPCDRCRPHGRFRPAPSERIVEILGYW